MVSMFKLLGIQLKAQYGLSSLAYNLKNDRKSLWKMLGIAFVILLAIAQLIGIYTYLMYQIYIGVLMLNTPQIIITMSVVITGIIIMLFGIFHILSALFLAKDIEFLASLPVSQGKVFLSKFLSVLLHEYPITLLLMLPPVIIYGVGQGSGIMYYVLAILCIPLIPLVPLVISAFLSLLLMNIVSKSKNRDLIIVVGSVALLILVFVGQNYLVGNVSDSGQDFMATIINSSNAFIGFMGSAFPPAIWITKILTGSYGEIFLNLLYLLLVSIGAIAIVYSLASFIYQKGATAQLETGIKAGKTKLVYNRSSHVFTIFKNEMRSLIRTPIYALNSLIMAFIAPFMLLLPLIGGNLKDDPDIQVLYSLLESSQAQPILMLIVTGVIVLLVLMNPAISTTFSREGKDIWILKNIPVKPETQVLGKFLAGYSIPFVGALLSSIVAMFSFRISFVNTLMVIVLSSLALIPINVVGLYIDLIRPKLVWNNQQEAIKQNFNVFISMLLGFLVFGAFAIIAFLVASLNYSVYIMFSIISLILVASSYTSLFLLRKGAAKAYSKIAA